MSTPQLLHSSRRRVLLGRGLGGKENSPGERQGEFSTDICYGKKEKIGTGGERNSNVRGVEGLEGDDSVSACVCSGAPIAPPKINERAEEGSDVEKQKAERIRQQSLSTADSSHRES